MPRRRGRMRSNPGVHARPPTGAAPAAGFAEALLAEGPAALVACGADGVVTFASASARELLGDGALGRPLTALVAPTSQGEVSTYLGRVAAEGSADGALLEVRVGEGAGERVLELTAANRLAHPALGAILLALGDVTARRRREAELLAHATSDRLTGLASRLVVLDRLAEIARSGRGGAVAIVDLDRFKLVNDAHGHATGDRLLARIAARLAEGLPEEFGGTVGRYGGDEFAILLPGLGPARAAAVVDGLLARVCAPIDTDTGEVTITASAGVATIDGPRDAALNAADAALYAAKRRRARVLIYDEEVVRAERNASREFDVLRLRAASAAAEARTDALTGLANRRKFDEDVDLFDGTSPSAARYAVVFLDLDNFGPLNKAHGQDVGDQALQRAARVFAQSVREGDTVYRHGGEEMVALLDGATLEEAAGVAERMRRALAEPAAGAPTCTVSIGVAAHPSGREGGCREVVRAADRAMRHAKEAGPNRVAVERADGRRLVVSPVPPA